MEGKNEEKLLFVSLRISIEEEVDMRKLFIFLVSLCVFLGVLGISNIAAQELVNTWGFNGSAQGWTLATAGAGNVTVSGAAPPTGWVPLRGEFTDVTPTVGQALVVTGNLELIGGGLTASQTTNYPALRYGVYQDNGTAGNLVGDSWDGTAGNHYGYLLVAPSGTGGDVRWQGINKSGTFGGIVNRTWYSTNGGNDYVLGDRLHQPEDALASAGMYDFAMSIAPLADGNVEVRYYLVKQDNSYYWADVAIDDVLRVGPSFNCVNFSISADVSATGLALTNVTVDLGDPIDIPEPPAGMIVVDGEKDIFYELLTGPEDGYIQIQAFHNSAIGIPDGNADLSAKVWGAWDPVDTLLYLYAEITDDSVSCPNASNFWRNDCFELKIDGIPYGSVVGGPPTTNGLSATNTITALDTPAATGMVSNLENLTDDEKTIARGTMVNGYTLEMALRLDALGGAEAINFEVDSIFGLGINVVDNDGMAASPGRTAAIVWAAVCTDNIWNTPDYLGKVQFKADNKIAFIATNNNTGDTNALPYDGTVPMVVVDGELDPFYKTLNGPDEGYLQIKSYAFNDNGIPHGDNDLSAKLWAAWDPTWLYLYTEVVDDTIAMVAAQTYNNDGMELKLDPQPTDSVANSTFAPSLTALDTGAVGGVANGLTDSTMNMVARQLTDDGYALEWAIKWEAITASAETVSVAIDSVFGLAINIHDNDNAGNTNREASIQWAAVLLDAVWNTPKYEGTVKFLADNKLQFIPSNNMTGVTNEVPYDGTPFYMRIDGQKDPFYWGLAGPDEGYLQLRSYAYNDNGMPDDDADLSAKMWFAWDDDNLYFYEEVKDDTISMSSANSYNNDGFEIKVDPQATDSVTNSIVGLGMTALDTTGGITGALDLPNSFRKTVTGGYVLEAAIPWTDLATTTESVDVGVGNVFGCAVQNHDNDNTTGMRDASVQWAAVLLDAVWNTPKYCGTVEFLADNQLEFIPTNNMTGVTNDIPYDGSDYVGVEEAASGVPMRFSLAQNYPNPFNPTTRIAYEIPSVSKVRLIVYDVLGREVATLVDEVKKPGTYETTFDGKKFSSGVYFFRLEAGSRTQVKKMMILK